MRGIIFGVLLCCVAMSPRADLGEGRWEMEVTTTMSGMQPTTAKQTQCLSAADARDPSKLFGTPGAGCEFKNRRDNGSEYRFDISCGGAAKVEGSGAMRYSRDALEGEIVLRVNPGGQAMETRSTIKAKRLGAC
jgi:hypothetical protein